MSQGRARPRLHELTGFGNGSGSSSTAFHDREEPCCADPRASVRLVADRSRCAHPREANAGVQSACRPDGPTRRIGCRGVLIPLTSIFHAPRPRIAATSDGADGR